MIFLNVTLKKTNTGALLEIDIEGGQIMMSLNRWNPFEELSNLHRAIDWTYWPGTGEFPEDRDRSWVPATEVTSDKEGWTVRMALPGIHPKDVQVDLHNNAVTVTGKRTSNQDESERYVSEFGYGVFERTVKLPTGVDAEKVAATFEHGMLELRLPVAEGSKPRRIEVGSVRSQAA